MGGRETPATAKIRAELPCATAARSNPVFAVPLGFASVRAPLFGRPGGAHPADRPPAKIR